MDNELLYEAARTLLKDTQAFFQLGSINNSSVVQSNDQFAFINKILKDFLVQYEQSQTNQFFFKLPTGKKISIRKKADLERDYQVCSTTGDFESILKLLRHICSGSKLKKTYQDFYHKAWK